MIWQRIRIAMFVCTVLAVSASSAFAQDGIKGGEKIAPPTEKVVVPPGGPITSAPMAGCGAAPCGAPCGTRTVYVTECVPESYTATRTVYKTECKTECYTAYRCERVPECRERTVCVTKRVPVMKTEIRKVCVTVPVCEDRTVMKQTWTYQNVTTMQCRTVDRGHWECKEVYSHRKAFSNWLGGFGKGHGHHKSNDCCNPCPQQCEQTCQAPATKTVKVWVSCKVTEQCPVTTCKKVCVNTPCTTKVTVNRTEWKEQAVQVCSYQCVTENRVEKYTVCTTRQVPYQATRTVRVCVPCQETYTACRMVSRTVARQVADTTSCCSSPCSNACSNDCCETSRGGWFKKLGGLFNRGGHSHGHQTSGSCCN